MRGREGRIAKDYKYEIKRISRNGEEQRKRKKEKKEAFMETVQCGTPEISRLLIGTVSYSSDCCGPSLSVFSTDIFSPFSFLKLIIPFHYIIV